MVICACGHEIQEHMVDEGTRGECLVLVPGDHREAAHFCRCKRYEPVPLGESGTLEEAAGW